MRKPILAITMGDPAGIGAEITVKALSDPAIYEQCSPLVIGDADCMRAAVHNTHHKEMEIRAIEQVGDAAYQSGVIDVLDLGMVNMPDLVYGKVSAMGGNAAFAYVKQAIQLALTNDVDATVTNALNKEALNLAGHHFAGHTEIYAQLTNTKTYTMMLVHGNVRVVHVSTHVSLKRAIELVTKERVLDVIRIADAALKDIGIRAPKIGVAGLNPHCGENGLFGDEELREICPAVAAARAEGILAEGPIPADTVFSKARGGWYDVVIAMYHDQGHIPLKLLGFVYDREKQRWETVEGVNITLGLPIIRTSVDHGTAFDLAGQGIADESSLKTAITYAAQIARQKITGTR